VVGIFLISVRIMESVREGAKVVQKTVSFVGSSSSPQRIELLKQMAQTLPVKLGNDRQPALPGMDRIVYSKEPEYYKFD